MADSRFEVFRGYICQDLSAEEEKDEDEADDEQDWDDQELDAIAAGALHIQPKKPPYRKGRTQNSEGFASLLVLVTRTCLVRGTPTAGVLLHRVVISRRWERIQARDSELPINTDSSGEKKCCVAVPVA